MQDGQLVICRLEYGPEYRHEIRPQAAAHDYAILIDWPNDTCTPRLFVYDRPHGHVDEARSFETFLELVDRLPRGVPVAWVNTCCAPISYGMGTESETRLRAVVRRGGHTLLTAGESLERAGRYDDLLICTCESVRMYLPGNPVPARGDHSSRPGPNRGRSNRSHGPSATYGSTGLRSQARKPGVLDT